jgi:hypothetical protein
MGPRALARAVVDRPPRESCRQRHADAAGCDDVHLPHTPKALTDAATDLAVHVHGRRAERTRPHISSTLRRLASPLVDAPLCSRAGQVPGEGFRVSRDAMYGRAPRRQRYRCTSPDGWFHRFTPPLPREHTNGGVCVVCDSTVAAHARPVVSRAYRHRLHLVAEALVGRPRVQLRASGAAGAGGRGA